MLEKVARLLIRTPVAASPRMTIENWELSIGQISFDQARALDTKLRDSLCPFAPLVRERGG
jgi:hypothetical protein